MCKYKHFLERSSIKTTFWRDIFNTNMISKIFLMNNFRTPRQSLPLTNKGVYSSTGTKISIFAFS